MDWENREKLENGVPVGNKQGIKLKSLKIGKKTGFFLDR